MSTTKRERARLTQNWYSSWDDATHYVVDRRWAYHTWDVSGAVRAVGFSFYDASGTGDKTRESIVLDVPADGNIWGPVLHTTDTTFIYDAYGNQTSASTYAGSGTTQCTSACWSFSAPGSSSAARTTTTAYDGTFHVFSTSVTNQLTQVEQAGYDYRMGTLTSVTDLNGNVTSASYDTFGRLTTLIKPGDSSGAPTLMLYYVDTERPFRYATAQREQAGTGNLYYRQLFYDGLGRQIQTKQEGPGAWQNIVVDTRYDGLGRAIEQSQARYSTENSSTFWQYTAPSATLFNHTTTTYDALGRELTVTAPDGTTPVRKNYWVGGWGTAIDIYDANNHATVQHYDMLDRLRQVYEYQGNNGSEGGYTNPAVTSYSYSPLDQLTQVTDHLGNVTSMGYDSLGRKTSMSDPDMGAWSYQYDANGNLLSKTFLFETLSFRTPCDQ